MRPVRPSDRGSAVEDIQRRLLTLGYDLGRSGVDGVFLGATLAAVKHFQQANGLAEDGIVGPETWSRLVDETFTVGDRLLYLRFPYLHGRDVREVQGALNALGFPCGEPDGIFGTMSERAVRDFQRNTGLTEDGIVGLETVRALANLRHVWGDKEPRSAFQRTIEPSRSADALALHTVVLSFSDEGGQDLALRVTSTARAACEGSRLVDIASGRPVPEDSRLTIVMLPHGAQRPDGQPAVDASRDQSKLAEHVFAAAAAAPVGSSVSFVMPASMDDHGMQRMAVALLDGLCAALSAPQTPML